MDHQQIQFTVWDYHCRKNSDSIDNTIHESTTTHFHLLIFVLAPWKKNQFCHGVYRKIWFLPVSKLTDTTGLCFGSVEVLLIVSITVCLFVLLSLSLVTCNEMKNSFFIFTERLSYQMFRWWLYRQDLGKGFHVLLRGQNLIS